MTDNVARIIWSLTTSGAGTAISGAGNSGSYTATGVPYRSAVDVRHVDDLWLSASATAGSGTSLKVQVNFYDDQGNLFQFLTGTTPLLGVTVASAPGSAIAFAGRHGGGGTGQNYIVPSEWAQVAWAITGSMTGVNIALYGR